jgi:hypothetical protein
MKILLSTLILLLVCKYLQAQKRDSVHADVDTINIRGYIYFADDIPAKNIKIFLRNPIFDSPGFTSNTVTDTNGYFEFRGVYPNNEIGFYNPKYGESFLPINGSRYLAIYLPAQNIHKLNERDSIFTTAKRQKTKRKIPVTYYDEGKIFPDFETYYPEPLNRKLNLVEFIQKNVTYPQAAIENNIEGIVEIGFTVSKEGNLEKFNVIKGIGYGCEEEVIKILKKTGEWRQGLKYGSLFEILETVSIKFSLTDK